MLYQLSYSRPDPERHCRHDTAPGSSLQGRARGPAAGRHLDCNLFYSLSLEWGGEDSNLCRLAPADLQSAPIGQLGHLPNTLSKGNLSDPNREGKKMVRGRESDPSRCGFGLPQERTWSGKPPDGCPDPAGSGAGEGTRTPNHLITNEMLYQLSYASSLTPGRRRRPRRLPGAGASNSTRRSPSSCARDRMCGPS